jgi:phosphoglycolate phosphatase-like HAD superfamily hydrolase
MLWCCEGRLLKPTIGVLITDLDNTLFDWFRIWHRSFTAMLEKISELSGIPKEVLEPEIKLIHEKNATSEYAFLIEEMPSLKAKHPGENLTTVYEPAILAFREARKAELHLYPRVRATLEVIRDSGCLIIGYTESLEFYSTYRVRKLGLDGLLHRIYFPPDHDLPDSRDHIRHYPPDAYQLLETKIHHTPKGEIKPNPALLSRILMDAGGSKGQAAYVGDSLMKDVTMAQSAGIKDVWAKYGGSHEKAEYELLRRVTHWTAEAVEKEKLLKSGDVSPTYVLQNSFAELLDLFDFTRRAPPNHAGSRPETTL